MSKTFLQAPRRGYLRKSTIVILLCYAELCVCVRVQDLPPRAKKGDTYESILTFKSNITQYSKIMIMNNFPLPQESHHIYTILMGIKSMGPIIL